MRESVFAFLFQGSFELRAKLGHALQGRNPGTSLSSFVDGYVTRYAVEQTAYISRNFDRELDRKCTKTQRLDLHGCPSAVDGCLEVGTEAFEAPEGLFKPELWGLDQAGVHVLVHKAIRECATDIRKILTQNVFLAGGLTLLPGFPERLEAELERLNPSVKPRVLASPYRYHAAYLGACVQAGLDTFGDTMITRDEFSLARSKLSRLWSL